MAVSQKQHEANIRNAQLARGPRTEAGKFRSRRNAIKHGLSGSPDALALVAREELQAELAAFAAVYRPRDTVERRYVEQAASASVRHNRARAEAEALLQRRRDTALRDWDERRRAEVDSALGRLRNDPAAALPILWRTAEGCDALCDAWADLGRLLDEEGTWGPVAAAKALALLGYNRPPDDDAPAEVREFAAAAKAISGALDFTDRMRLRRGKPLEGPDPAEAFDVLRAMVEERIARLSGLAEERWEKDDGPARAAAVGAAATEADGEVQKLRRYQAEAAREMRQALNGLAAHRREMRRMEDEERRRAREEESPARNEPISPVVNEAQPNTGQGVTPKSPATPATSPPADRGPFPPPLTANAAPAGRPSAPGATEIASQLLMR